MLDSYNIRNRFTFSTHIKHHYLDLVIKDQTDTLITHITLGLFLSDHCFTHAILDIVRPWPQRQTVSYWKFRSINNEAFRTDLHTALSSVNKPDLTKLVSIYNTTITDVLDKHTPIRSKTVKQSHKQPWFTDKIRKEIIIRLYKERLFRPNPMDYMLNAFYQQRQHVSNIIKTSKKNYYIGKLRENRNNFKMVFQIANKLLHRNETLPLPPTDDKNS